MPSLAEAVPFRDSRRLATMLAHATFVATGAITVMLGPLLPILTARWGLTDTRAGYLITAQFTGALLTTVSTSALVPRWGFRRTVAAGLTLMAIGAGTLMTGSFGTAIVAVVCYGAGIGLTIPTVNLMIAESHVEQRSSALNLLNFSWSAGAVACPFVLARLRPGMIPIFLHTMAAASLFLTMLVLLFGPIMARKTAAALLRNEPKPHYYFANSAITILGAIFFLYVGTENALSAWLASFAQRADLAGNLGWASVPSYFFAALLLGRVLAPISLRRWGDYAQSRAGLLIALVSIAGLLASHSITAIAVCTFFAGLGLSALYPIAIGFLASVFGSAASTVAGWMFALSTLGGATVPWLVGFASTRSGSLRTALTIPVVGCLLMLALYSSPRLRQSN